MATLNFKGKSFVQNHHLAVKYHQLIPKKEKNLTDKVSLNDNLIIHGDNLIALKDCNHDKCRNFYKRD
jgi:adenine-specific DNA-methyltransferase